MKFVYEVPDEQLQQLAEDFVLVYEYKAKIEEFQESEVVAEDGTKSKQSLLVSIDNPVTPLQFVVNKVQDFMNDVSRSAKRKRADIAAAAAAEKEVTPSVVITVL